MTDRERDRDNVCDVKALIEPEGDEGCVLSLECTGDFGTGGAMVRSAGGEIGAEICGV